jgi:hypothetical protein
MFAQTSTYLRTVAAARGMSDRLVTATETREGVERVGLRSAVLSTIPIFLVQLLPRRSFESKVLCIFRIRSVLSDWLHVRKSALISELGVKRFFHIGKVLD